MSCDVAHDDPSNATVGACSKHLVRCWENDDSPTGWTCNTRMHDRESWGCNSLRAIRADTW